MSDEMYMHSEEAMLDRMCNDGWMQDLQRERYERTVETIYQAAMYGLPEEMVRWLCYETGVKHKDVCEYQPFKSSRQSQLL